MARKYYKNSPKIIYNQRMFATVYKRAYLYLYGILSTKQKKVIGYMYIYIFEEFFYTSVSRSLLYDVVIERTRIIFTWRITLCV